MVFKEDIERLVEEKTAGTEFFLVDVKVSPAKIAVFIDHPQGIKLSDCMEISRYLQAKLDEDLETHELEVSSPGIDGPLKVLKQYRKLTGKPITVLLKNGIRKEGKLIGSDEEGIEIESHGKIKFEEIKLANEKLII